MTAPAAGAASCEPVLFDGEGWEWDLETDGGVSDGTGDAFDGYANLEVDGAPYPGAGLDACGREDGDREVTYPNATMSGLNVSRKVYVPTDDGFARWLDILNNPSGSPITVTVSFGGNLGSDGDTRVRATEDGDTTDEPSDAWVVTDDGDPDNELEDPSLSHIFDASIPAPDESDANDPFATTDDTGERDYTTVTVPAGGTFIFMHSVAQNGPPSTQEAIDDAVRISRGPETLYSGLSEDERSQLRNFPADGDVDVDGVTNRSDNCVRTANADQADNDADVQGDACDADDDNDTLTDEVEVAIGTDPRNADTDGDSVRDDADQCPREPAIRRTGAGRRIGRRRCRSRVRRRTRG